MVGGELGEKCRIVSGHRPLESLVKRRVGKERVGLSALYVLHKAGSPLFLVSETDDQSSAPLRERQARESSDWTHMHVGTRLQGLRESGGGVGEVDRYFFE